MIEKYKKNPRLRYFALYSFTYLFFGCFISATGPVIPFLSHEYGIPQTQFTLFFSIHCRQIQEPSLITGIPFMLFPFTDSLNLQGFYIFLSSVFFSGLEIVLTVSVVQGHKGNSEQFWLQQGHGFFGVGGFLGPVFIAFWGEYGLVWIGLGISLGFVGYAYLQSPEILNKQEVQITFNKTQEKKEQQAKPISKFSLALLMIMLFTYIGEEYGFDGWISSYVVIQGLDTKQGATRFPALFWIFITIFRFVLAGFHGKISQKLLLLAKIQISVYACSIILTMLGLPLFAVYWNSILQGIAYSSMYPLIYTLSIEFNQSITQSQTAKILMFGSLGEGVICTSIGYLMKIIDPIAFFYSLIFAGILMLIFIKTLINDLAKNEPGKEWIELREKISK